MNSHTLLLILAFLALVCAPVNALSSEQKKARKAASEEADKDIFHLPANKIVDWVKKPGTTLLFLGAKWCTFTQKFTPKWLEVQKKVDADPELKDSGFRMVKFECTLNESQACDIKTDGTSNEQTIAPARMADNIAD
ncbi:hypothetical protein BDK51DRAFT_28098 [Blyttiomyces helicus]|uniref:Thioredoxin domain-containing protein n=1 Tax=Blyttiomyces helicus TaxID=388810 RepID=A0A4V1IRD9_9FUNG|nr:hypothetical protein BDK51DRAFT_28098 [Blyttiomyces helicus]|eukprot:RKO89717.1 hypothetical protein BDK51DRAFT_28098 [Blyttiomyces helicus]